MLPYAHLLSNGKSVTYDTHGVDTPVYYRMHIFSAMRHVYNMIKRMIDVSFATYGEHLQSHQYGFLRRI